MKKTQKKVKESTSTQVDHSQFLNSDGYAQAVDVEVAILSPVVTLRYG